MSWTLSLMDSVFSRTRTAPVAAPERLEALRQSMLDVLGDPQAADVATLWRRIRLARDAEALWYLRGDLMTALAGQQGERAAQAAMRSITAGFGGLLPPALARTLR